jgi:hypothetical protein
MFGVFASRPPSKLVNNPAKRACGETGAVGKTDLRERTEKSTCKFVEQEENRNRPL